MRKRKRRGDVEQLVNMIKEFESENDYVSRIGLFRDIAASEWGRRRKITTSVIYHLMTEYGVECETPMGKRGRPRGATSGASTSN